MADTFYMQKVPFHHSAQLLRHRQTDQEDPVIENHIFVITKPEFDGYKTVIQIDKM